MTDLSNPDVIPNAEDSHDDKELTRLGEHIVITYELVGRDSLEFRRLALKQGMSPNNFGKLIALNTVRKLRNEAQPRPYGKTVTERGFIRRISRGMNF